LWKHKNHDCLLRRPSTAAGSTGFDDPRRVRIRAAQRLPGREGVRMRRSRWSTCWGMWRSRRWRISIDARGCWCFHRCSKFGIPLVEAMTVGCPSSPPRS
jgi:hypothetical protein